MQKQSMFHIMFQTDSKMFYKVFDFKLSAEKVSRSDKFFANAFAVLCASAWQRRLAALSEKFIPKSENILWTFSICHDL